MDVIRDELEMTRRYGRYVEDLRRLFVFHGLHCGTAQDFPIMTAKLMESGAFRTDVLALARCVRDMEKGQISKQEMLSIAALASGGEESETQMISPGSVRTAIPLHALLDEVGGWKQGEALSPPGDAGRSGDSGIQERNGSSSSTEAIRGVEGAQFSSPASPAVRERRLVFSAARMSEGNGDGSTEDHFGWDAPVAVSVATEVQRVSSKIEAGETARETGIPDAESVALPPPPVAGVSGLKPIPEQSLRSEKQEMPEDTKEISVSATKKPMPLNLRSPEVAFQDAIRASGARKMEHEGDRQPRSRRESVGRMLGIAAVVLAVIGIASLAIPSRSTRAPEPSRGEAQQSTERKTASLGGSEAIDPAGKSAPAATKTVLGSRRDESAVPNRDAPHTDELVKQASITRPESAGSRSSSRPAAPSGELPIKGEQVLGANRVGKGAGGNVRAPGENDVGVHGEGKVEGAPGTSARAIPAASLAARTKAADTPDQLPIRAGSRAGAPLIPSPSEMNRHLISSKIPVYPPEALREHLAGRVVLNTFLTREGTVRRMDVVEGSSLFIKSAMAAVSWRRYRPFLVAGKPVEVQTQITVDYPAH